MGYAKGKRFKKHTLILKYDGWYLTCLTAITEWANHPPRTTGSQTISSIAIRSSGLFRWCVQLLSYYSLGVSDSGIVWVAHVRISAVFNVCLSVFLIYSSPFDRPFIRNFARSSNLRLHNSFGLIIRVFIVQFATLLACRVPAVVLDVQATQVSCGRCHDIPLYSGADWYLFEKYQGFDFTPLARKGGMTSDKYLLEALQSSDDFYLVRIRNLCSIHSCHLRSRLISPDSLST
jgi:hypothetical protein